MTIKFFFNEVSITLPDRKRLKQFLIGLFDMEGKILSESTYVFCSDKYLLSINQEFLQHDNYTDIITFTLSDNTEPIIGEIYISSERVKENARKLEITINRELHRVIFHGALHLCGYNDKTPADKKAMTLKEDKYLQLYFS